MRAWICGSGRRAQLHPAAAVFCLLQPDFPQNHKLANIRPGPNSVQTQSNPGTDPSAGPVQNGATQRLRDKDQRKDKASRRTVTCSKQIQK